MSQGQRRATSAFKWQIPFADYVDARHDLLVLQECDVIRGILALFFGASCSRVYAKNQNSISVRDNVRIERTSRQGSEDWLTFYACYGEKMSCLLELLYPESDQLIDGHDQSDLMSNTLSGYLITLRQVVHQAARVLVQEGDQFLAKYKKNGADAVELHTFRQFMTSRSITSLLKTIDFLYQAHNQVIKSQDFVMSNYRCTPHIINVFHKHLTVSAQLQDRTIAWNLFLATLRPTLFYLDEMIDKGFSRDAHEEFMFEIGDVDLDKDMNFWQDCLILKDEQAVPLILKPLIHHLMRAIRSRLLLLGCGIQSNDSQQKKGSTFDLFYSKWIELQKVPSSPDRDRGKVSNDLETSRSETPDSGEGDELETDSRSTDNDVSDAVLASAAPVVSSAESVDEGLGAGLSAAADFGPGQLRDLQSLKFANTTPLDCTYFENKMTSVQIDNPDMDHLPEFDNELRYDLPEHLRTPFKLALEKSLYPVIIDRCHASSADLMTAFRVSFNRHLKFHTDYWLLHKDSHSISLYLDKLFQQITSSESKQHMFLFHSYHFDDESDVRACVMYSHRPQDLDSPIKILNRLHIQYREMEPFSKLLLSPQIRQSLADAFHFLIIVKYSRWLLCSINLRNHLHQVNFAGDNLISDPHALFCLRFRSLKAVTQLLEHVMFELHDAILGLEYEMRIAPDFDHMKDSLSAFADRVKKATLSDKNKSLTDAVCRVAVNIKQMKAATGVISDQVQRLEKIVALICDKPVQ